MTTTKSLQQTKIQTPEIFEVYFYTSPWSLNPLDILFNKGNKDYHRMYGFQGAVVHCAVRLGEFVYEVTAEGTVKYPWCEQVLDNPRMIGFYMQDIKSFSVNKRLAALFTLENCLGRKLNIRNCLKFLVDSIGLFPSHDILMDRGYKANQNLTLEQGTYDKSTKSFHLPYTCATLVNIVLNRLHGYEPSINGHLAQSATLTLNIFSDLGQGVLYELEVN